MKCQTLATNARLPGTYKAWVSDSTSSPSTRFTRATIPYVRVDGTAIATSWTDLTTATNLAAAINVTETGGTPPVAGGACGYNRMVWTSTNRDGTLYPNGNCSDWTSPGGGGSTGDYGATQYWTDWCSGGVCSGQGTLYCFEQ